MLDGTCAQYPSQDHSNLVPSPINQDNIEADIEEDQPLVNDSQPKKLRESNIRWLVLFLTIMTSFGCYYCYDNPQPLQAPMQEIFGIQDAKFNMVFSVALLPNLIAPFIGGILIDSIGIRITMIIFLIVVNIGQAIITIGAYIMDFEIIIAGRFVFGVGHLIVEAGLIVMVTKWFLTKEFTFAWGLARSILRTSSALNSFLTPKIYYMTNQLYAPFLFGLMILLFSLLCVLLVTYIDKKAEKELKVVVSANFIERIMFKDIKLLTKIYYIMLVFTVLIYGSFHGLTNNLNNILVQRFGFNLASAGSTITILFFVAALLSPFIGLITDRIGKRVLWMFIGTVLIFIGQFSFLFLEDTSPGQPNYWVISSLICFGLFYAFFSTSFWTSISLVVKFQAVGTGIGLISCVTSIQQSLYTEILGFIHDNSLEVHKGYYYSQILQCGLLAIAFIFSIWLYFEDKKTGGRLQKAKVEVKEKDY